VFRYYNITSDSKRLSRVYYQTYDTWNKNERTEAVLNQASDDVRKYASTFRNFNATVVIVVTWSNLYSARSSIYPYGVYVSTCDALYHI